MTAHTPKITRAAEGLGRRRFTVTEMETMVSFGLMGDERNELIGGEVVPMSPKGSRHETLKTRLNIRWCRAAPDGYVLTPETTFRLSDDTYLEPDFVIYEQSVELTALTGHNVLLVVEIADTSLRYDTGRKAALYASFGVRELWVIDAVKLKTRVFRDPSANGYATAFDVTTKGKAAPLLVPSVFALRLADLGLACTI